MLNIKFLDEIEVHEITYFKRINENIVCMGLDTDNVSGFETYIGNEKIGDFIEYTTIYKKENGHTYFSKDGSIWVEPTTKLKAVFDSEPPEKVEVYTSFGESIFLEKPSFSYEVKGEYVKILHAQQLNDYNQEINGSTVFYTEKPEGQKEQEKYDKEIDDQTLRLAEMFVRNGINSDDFMDRIDAQLLYTALMTDTLVEVEEGL